MYTSTLSLYRAKSSMRDDGVYSSMGGARLMALYQGGDIEAFRFLYERYKSQVYGYLCKRVERRDEVDEVFQDIFFRLHSFRSRYKSEFPFEPWLYAIVRNSLIDHFRKRKKTYNDVSLEELQVLPEALQVEDRHEHGEFFPENSCLSASQRRAIELRYGEDFSFEGIAEALGITSSNARQLVSRGLRKLRKVFGSRGVV